MIALPTSSGPSPAAVGWPFLRLTIYATTVGLALTAMLQAGAPCQFGQHDATPCNHPHHQHANPTVPEIVLLSFEDFKALPYAEGMIPPEMTALAGKTIGIVGYMMPMDSTTEVRHLWLVENSFGCCFGEPPLPWHLIDVRLDPSIPSLPFELAPLKIEGPLTVKERYEGEELVSVYQVVATRAELLMDELTGGECHACPDRHPRPAAE